MLITAALACVLPAAAGAVGFSQPMGSPYAVGDEGINGIAVGDLNKDGRDDVVSVNSGPLGEHAPSYSVMLANPDGSLSPAPGGRVTMTSYPGRVALGDVNGDHNLDLIISEETQVSVFLGHGDGAFAAAPLAVLSGGGNPFALAAADLNDDGLDDVVVANYGSNNVSVYISTGDGFEQAPGSPYLVGTAPRSVTVGDLNGDGRPDIVTGNHFSGSGESFFPGAISVLLQQGDGSFAPAPGSPLEGEWEQTVVALGHFDENDSLDIAAAAQGNERIVFQLNNGDGTFTGPSTPGSYPSHFVTSITVADFDGNGLDDVVLPIYESGNDPSVQVFYGAGAGTLSPADSYPVAGGPNLVATGDFNGDGHPDIVVGNNSTLSVLLDLVPEMVVEPAELDFGGVEVGDSAGPEAVRVANEGSATLNLGDVELSGADADEFSFDASDCAAALEPGEECTVEVEFTPSGPGTAAATLEVGQEGGPAALVELSGEGLARDASLSPSTHDFGDTPVTTVHEETFVLHSTGGLPLQVGAPTITGADADEFEILDDGCGSEVLPPDESCEILVGFTPLTEGAKSAQLEVPTDGVSPTSAGLEGTGAPDPEATLVAPEFQETAINGSSFVEAELTSSGSTDLGVGVVAITGPDANQFEIVSAPCSGQTLHAGDECGIEVVFQPTSAGRKTATLEVDTDAVNGPIAAALEGTASNADLLLSPTGFDFGGQPADGTAGDFAHFELSSVGETAGKVLGVELVGADPGEFEITTDTCSGTTLPNGEHCEVTVAFAPHSEGAKSALLEITSNSNGGPLSASLEGVGLGLPTGTISPLEHDFGEVLVGGESAAQDFTVENTGDAPLQVDGATLVGAEAGQFELDEESCDGIELAPDETCQLSVTFAPTAGGAHTAGIEIQSDAATTIRGEVEGSGRLEPGIAVTPALLSFIGQFAGAGPGEPQAITVESNGATPLHVDSVSLGGEKPGQFEVVADECARTTVAVGDRCLIEVAFNPTEIGTTEATLTIESDAGGAAVVQLVGVAYRNPGIAVDPAGLDFGEQVAGAGAGTPQTITVESIGTTPLEMDAPEFEGADADQFQIVDNRCAGARLAPGESCEIEVGFAPTSTGGKSAGLIIASNNTHGFGPPIVALTGTGTETPKSSEEEKTSGETKPGETKPDEAKTDEGKPAPPVSTPKPKPPVCVPVTVKKLAPYTVETKGRPGSPGLRARFTLGAPGLVEVTASVTYRLDGKPHTASLGKSRLQAGLSVNYKVAIPAKLRPDLTPGTPVTLKLRYRAKGSAAGCSSFGKPATKSLRTQVVLISR